MESADEEAPIAADRSFAAGEEEEVMQPWGPGADETQQPGVSLPAPARPFDEGSHPPQPAAAAAAFDFDSSEPQTWWLPSWARGVRTAEPVPEDAVRAPGVGVGGVEVCYWGGGGMACEAPPLPPSAPANENLGESDANAGEGQAVGEAGGAWEGAGRVEEPPPPPPPVLNTQRDGVWKVACKLRVWEV